MTNNPGSELSMPEAIEIKHHNGDILYRHPYPSLQGHALRKVYLRGAVLDGLDLRGVELTDVDLREARLVGLQLQGAKLTDVCFDEADLTNANFSGAQLNNVSFKEANMLRADLSRINTDSIYDKSLDFFRAKLFRANLQDSSFCNANFNWADLRRANCQGVDFDLANLSFTNLRKADLREAKLGSVDLNEAVLYRTDLSVVSHFFAHSHKKKWFAYFDASTQWPRTSPLTRFRAVPWYDYAHESIGLGVGFFFIFSLIIALASWMGIVAFETWATPILFISILGSLLLFTTKVYQQLLMSHVFEHTWRGPADGVKWPIWRDYGDGHQLVHAGIDELLDAEFKNVEFTSEQLHDLLQKLAEHSIILDALDLSRTAVSDSHLKLLTKFPCLVWLDLTGTEISDKGIKELVAALPNTEIVTSSDIV